MMEIRQGKPDKESAEKKRPICAMESRVLQSWMAGQSDQIPLEGGVVVFGGDGGKELDADTAHTNPWVWHLASGSLLVDRHDEDEDKSGSVTNLLFQVKFVSDLWAFDRLNCPTQAGPSVLEGRPVLRQTKPGQRGGPGPGSS